MKYNNTTASLFVPDGQTWEAACGRTTHLGIGAHQDDLEIMAFHGIRLCYGDPGQWFGGVVCTDGSGSARAGKYAAYSDEEMVRLRREEQERAAVLGRYGFVAQLDYPSSSVKNAEQRKLEEDLLRILTCVRPGVVYTHNPADKHETHVAVMAAVINAIRRLPLPERPGTVYGCEAWRGLDWLPDEAKVALDVTDEDGLGKRLIEVFDSQVAGGKRYDLATLGRWRANATYFQAHEIDRAGGLSFAMDLSPLAADDSIDLLEFVTAYLDRFRRDVESKLKCHI
ncbi:MAG: PIG-L family deacetylase [bacterium]|nr:PIG-L family deacetylase [bacterium]